MDGAQNSMAASIARRRRGSNSINSGGVWQHIDSIDISTYHGRRDDGGRLNARARESAASSINVIVIIKLWRRRSVRRRVILYGGGSMENKQRSIMSVNVTSVAKVVKAAANGQRRIISGEAAKRKYQHQHGVTKRRKRKMAASKSWHQHQHGGGGVTA